MHLWELMMILCKADTNELFLDGVIGADWTGDGVTTAAVGDALKLIKGRVTVRINSPGGSADEGVAIYNMLKRHPGGVDTHNEALAASAASVIFLAGDKRTMERGSKLMIHRAHAISIGNQESMRKMADVLDLYDQDMAKLYADFMGVDETAVLSLMTDETWFDAQTAVENGLATTLSPTLKKKTAAAAAWFKKPPQDLLEENAIAKASGEAKRAFMHMKLQLARV